LPVQATGKKLRGSRRNGKPGNKIKTVRKELSSGSGGTEEWVVEVPEGMDPGLEAQLSSMNVKHVALFCAWLVNGQNISAAARSIGYAPVYAMELFRSHPSFQDAKQYIDRIMTLEDQEWIECLPQARQTLRSLLLAKDEKVRYLAAKDIVDRAEGKATTRVDMTVRDERPSLTDAEMQLAFSLIQQTGISFAEARDYIKGHPDEVSAWIAANVPLATAGGREVAALPAPEEPEPGNAPGLRINAIQAEGLPEEPPAPESPSETIPGASTGILEVPPVLAFGNGPADWT
jgi:hypothetical protein